MTRTKYTIVSDGRRWTTHNADEAEDEARNGARVTAVTEQP